MFHLRVSGVKKRRWLDQAALIVAGFDELPTERSID